MIRESESEFKAAAAGMDDWSKSSDGISAKIKQLNTTTDLQRQKVEALQKEYDRLIAEGLDPTSKQAIKLRTDINKETADLNKNEKELEAQTAALEAMGNESEEASKDVEKLDKSTSDSSKGFSALEGVTKGVSAGFSGLKTAAAVGAAAIAAVGAAAVAGLNSLMDLEESTRETRNEMARLETGFTTAGLSAEDATETYNTLYGVLGDTGQASEAASHLALLANNTEDLQKWTDIATGVYAQFGASLPIEGLTEAANETAKTGALTGSLADALNWAGVNEEEFQEKLDAASSEQERQALITETLNGLYSDQSDKFKELNADMIAAREAEAQFAQVQADLGAAMAPLNTKITEIQTNILTALSPAITQIITDITAVIDGAEGSTERLAGSVSTFLSEIVNKIVEMLPQFADFAIQLILMFAQTILEQLPSIAESAMEMIKTFSESLRPMVPYIISYAVDLIYSFVNSINEMLPEIIKMATELMVTLISTLVNKLPEVTQTGIEMILKLIDGISSMLPFLMTEAVDAVIGFAETIINNLPEIVESGIKVLESIVFGITQALPKLLNKAPELIMDLFNALMDQLPTILDAGVRLILELANGLMKAMPDLLAKLPTMISQIVKGIITEGIPALLGAGADLLAGLFEGMLNPSVIWENVKKVCGGIFDGIKDFFGISSPSKLFRDEIGKFLGEGMALGVGDGFDDSITGVNKAIVRSMGDLGVNVPVGIQNGSGALASGSGGVVVNQYNTYTNSSGSRYEIYKTKQATAAAVRLARGATA
nr:MAG TPA: minor tail protein [Bacteriophage sp.]